MLDGLRALKSAGSMAEVRRAVAELIAQLQMDAPAEEAAPTAKFLAARLDQIAASRTLERARYYLERLERSLTAARTNGVSDINLNRWQEYTDILTDSLWLIERRDNSGAHSAGYWGNFIPKFPTS